MLHLTTENGLPSNVIYYLYKDSKGFIWVATDKGIGRYNGIKFETFTTLNGITDNDVFLFKEDKYGRVWLGTYNGTLNYYKDGVMHNAQNTDFLNRLPKLPEYIKGISSEEDSSVIITFNRPPHLVFADIKNEHCRIVELDRLKDKSIAADYIVAKKNAPDKYKIFCTDKIVIVDTLYNVISVTNTDSALENKNRKFLSCQNQDYLFNENYLFNYNMQIVKRFPENFMKNYFLQQVYIADGNTFYATHNGLAINDSIHLFKDFSISSITKDNSGDYWIGTLENGVYIISNNFRQAKEYEHAYPGKAKFAYSDNDRLYFATTNNNLYSLENGAVRCDFDYGKYKNGHFPVALEQLHFIDKDHRYYNFYNNDIVVIDDLLKKNRSVHLTSHNTDLAIDGFKAILFTDSNIFIRKRIKIASIPYSRANIDDLLNAHYTFSVKSLVRILTMGRSIENETWYSTTNGVYKLIGTDTIRQPQFKNIRFNKMNFFGRYLVGYTPNNELYVCENYDGKNIKFNKIPAQNCIWDKIYELDQTHALISTNNAYRILTLLPGKAEQPYIISYVNDPFIPVQADIVCADSTHCYFLKNGSILTVPIEHLYEKPVLPKLYFSVLKTSKNTYPVSDHVQIPFSESRNIRVAFSTVIVRGKEVEYQYSFSKGDDSWQDINGEEINIAGPEYGRHIIKVRAKTTSGNYCEPITFILDIQKPYWATWWFILVVSLMVIVIMMVALRYRLKLILRKREKEHQSELKFVRSEFKALNALMNPHFIFNTLNNVQSLINKDDKRSANRYLRIFANLVRQNMHNISNDLISLQKEVEVVSNYLELEKLRFKEMLHYEVNIDEHLDLTEIMVPPLLLQPLVENSIKHGILPNKSTDSFIGISIYEQNGYCIIVVKDNGIGIDAAMKRSNKLHDSFSLENTRKRISQLGLLQNKEIDLDVSNITDEQGKLQWTIITISISLN